ncbi:RNA polymerase sigma factor [Salipaludibacillus sp. HK11]|uniref:RNA polymerase sigma factor n=1 Tax=Salipaludibacillus sp. HK11 TaxID=3394320 RepID=UPI0039FBA566
MEKLDKNREEKFEEICEQFMPLIYGLIGKWKLVGDKDEFIQTGRIALYDAWSRYDGDIGAFPAYAKSYVYGRFQISLERRNRWQTRFISTEPLTMTETNPFIVNNEENLLLLRDWLARTNLSSREKEWVNEAIFDGLKPREIAEKHDVAVSTVKSWRKEALKKLREETFELM